MTVGEKIKRIRKEKGLTQKELGDRLGGISQQQIGQWETGKANPKIETLQKISDALEVPITELLNYRYDIIDGKKSKIYDLTDMDIPQIIKAVDYIKNERIDTHKSNTIPTTLDIRENKVLSDFRQLNTTGKMEAIKRVEELTEIPRYTSEEKEAIDNYSEFVKSKSDDYWQNLKESLQAVDNQSKKETD